MTKKKLKKARKASVELIKTSTILGVGAGVVTQAGGDAAGVGKFASYMPTIGSVLGAGTALDLLKEVKVKKRKKKK